MTNFSSLPTCTTMQLVLDGVLDLVFDVAWHVVAVCNVPVVRHTHTRVSSFQVPGHHRQSVPDVLKCLIWFFLVSTCMLLSTMSPAVQNGLICSRMHTQGCKQCNHTSLLHEETFPHAHACSHTHTHTLAHTPLVVAPPHQRSPPSCSFACQPTNIYNHTHPHPHSHPHPHHIHTHTNPLPTPIPIPTQIPVPTPTATPTPASSYLIFVRGVLCLNSPLKEGKRVCMRRAASTRPSSPKPPPSPFALALFLEAPTAASVITHSRDLRGGKHGQRLGLACLTAVQQRQNVSSFAPCF